MAFQSSGHADRRLVVDVDQESRDGVLGVRCEVVEEETYCGTRVPPRSMRREDVVPDVDFPRKEPRPVAIEVDPPDDLSRHEDAEHRAWLRGAFTEKSP